MHPDSNLHANYLVSPDPSTLGAGNANAIAPLNQYGEVVTFSEVDGQISAIDGNGSIRVIEYFNEPNPIIGSAVAVDPTTSRIWVADNLSGQIWSVDSTNGTPTPDVEELTFPTRFCQLCQWFLRAGFRN